MKNTWRRCRRILAVAGVLLAAYAAGFGVFLALLPEPQVALPEVDGLAIFTGGSNRVFTGLQLVKDGFEGPVLISGVHPDVKMRELMVMVPLSRAQQGRLTLDTLAETTNANVVNTLMWADTHGVGRIGVVTSTYHALRCEILFWWYGALDRVWIIPVQPAVGGGPLGGVGPLLREYHKLLVVPFLD